MASSFCLLPSSFVSPSPATKPRTGLANDIPVGTTEWHNGICSLWPKIKLPRETCSTHASLTITLALLATRLVGTLERRHGLALVSVQGFGLDFTVAQLDLAVRGLLPCEGVFHPVLVITLGVVLTGVGTTGFLTVSGSNSGLRTIMVSVSFSFYQGVRVRTRKSTSYGAQESRPSPSSRSCCGPW